MLKKPVDAAKVEVGIPYGQGRERPWSSRVGVRIHELGVSDEYNAMRIGTRDLLVPLAPVTLRYTSAELASLGRIDSVEPVQ
jgi:hypothetical protein